jgi:hypothetical protein
MHQRTGVVVEDLLEDAVVAGSVIMAFGAKMA